MIDKKHWENALAVQNACNLSGVVISFAEAMRALCAEKLDTDARNKHPIAILFATQIAHLTRIESTYYQENNYHKAYQQAKQIVESKE